MSGISYALRSIARTPFFALASCVTFALSIGVNVAVFCAVDRVLFRPLPYDHAERLYVMRQYRGGTQPDAGLPASYVVRARQAPGVEELTLSGWNPFNFRFSDNPEGARFFSFVPVAHTFLRTLGVRPVIGVDFSEEDVKLQRSLAMVSHDVWETEFGRKVDILGRRVWGASPGSPYEISAVLPADFFPPQLRASEPWSGIVLTWQVLDSSTASRVFTPPLVRLKAGVSQAQAQAQVDAIVGQIGPEFPARGNVPASIVRVEPLRKALFGQYLAYAALVFTAAALVLLVGCANLAGLLVIRAQASQQTWAVHLALGSSRGRLVACVTAESLILAAGGSLIALATLVATQGAIVNWLPPAFRGNVSSLYEVRVFGLAVALTAVSALVVGLLPAWRLSRLNVAALLKPGREGTGSGPLRGTGLLLTVEAAISTILVIAALLTVRTFMNLTGVDVGFRPAGLLTVSAYLPSEQDKTGLFQRYVEMLDIIRKMPGVQSAAGADTLPMIGAANRPMFAGAQGSQRCPATEGLIEALQVQIVAGRTFTADDIRVAAPVGILSLDGLKFVLPGVTPAQAVGRFLQFPGESPREVIGIVSDVRHTYLAPSVPTLYVPISPERLNGMLFAVRADPGVLTSSALTAAFRARGLVPNSVQIRAVDQALSSSILDQSFRARLFVGFGVIALALAMVGIFAVSSAAAAQRRMELGIRLSLGATRGQVLRRVLRKAVAPIIIGVGVGLVTMYWMATFVQSFLFGVDARNLPTFAAVSALLIAAAVIAAWVPAYRASRTDPLSVLRHP